MKLLRRIGNAAGLVFDIAKILIAPSPHREEGDEAPVPLTPPTEPVVRVTPAAAEMVSRASPARQTGPAEDEPLEGSIEARRKQARWE